MTDLLEGKKAIDSKWGFRIKFKPGGEVDSYKTRLVAKAYNRTYGVDYIESFSPLAKIVNVKFLIAGNKRMGSRPNRHKQHIPAWLC